MHRGVLTKFGQYSILLITMFQIMDGSPLFSSSIDPSDPVYWRNLAIKKLTRFESYPFVLDHQRRKAKNVIIFIGDGMGISTITASRILKPQLPILQQFQQNHHLYKSQKDWKNIQQQMEHSEENGHLSFESFDSVALAKTYILDSQVGDSGACATAMMSGVKANFETVGVSGKVKFNDCEATIEPEARLSTIIDWAQQQGKSTGFVTTTRVTHATPAALYAHSASRYWESDDRMVVNQTTSTSRITFCKDIARQLFEDEPGKNLNVIMGGGRRNLLPKSGLNGKRLDGRNLIDVWLKDKAKRGLIGKYVSNRKQLQHLDNNKVDYLLGIFADNHMAHEVDRDQTDAGEPSLMEMTLKSLEILKHNPNGFVLVVESGRIDHAHHLNNAYRALTDTLALDETVEHCLKHLNLEQTLMVVTADHSHVFTFGGFPAKGNPILSVDNQPSDQDHLPYTTLMYANGPGHQQNRENLTGINTAHKDYIQQSAIPKRWETHGGEDVPIYSHGPGSWVFSGVVDQTFIPYGISYAACFGPMADLFCTGQNRENSESRILNKENNHNHQPHIINSNIHHTMDPDTNFWPKKLNYDHHHHHHGLFVSSYSSSSATTLTILSSIHWCWWWLWSIWILHNTSSSTSLSLKI